MQSVLLFSALLGSMVQAETPTATVILSDMTPGHVYKVNEPLRLTGGIVNRSKQPFHIDGRLYYKCTLFVRIFNKSGEDVYYADSQVRISYGRPERGDWVKVNPGVSLLRENFTVGRIALSEPGVYKVQLQVSLGQSGAYMPDGLSLCNFGPPAELEVKVVK